MPATTPGGLPYPLGTDLVVAVDDAIRNLATAVDTAAFGGSSRIRASAAAPAFTANVWATLPLNAQTDLHVPTSPVFTYTPASFGFTIGSNGLYLLSAGLTMSSPSFIGRIINGATTLAQQSNDASQPGTTVALSVVRWLVAGALITVQAFPSGPYTAPADSAGAPQFLSIAALTRVP